ncbi:MAG: hypothetical protein ACHP84_17640 [Caulobacterales bacterium]
MAQIEITQAAFAGFGIFRRQPLAPVVWMLLYVVAFALVFLLVGGAFISAIAAIMKAGPSAAPQQVLGMLGAVIGGYFLLLLVGWVVGAMVNMAVIRAVLEPENSAYAYLRLGSQELWLMLVNLVIFVLYFVLLFACFMVVGILSLLAGSNAGARAVLSFVGTIAIYGVMIWLWLRLSMAPAMVFADKRFRLFESWSMTRGHAGALFVVGVLVFVVAFALEIVLMVIGFAVGAGFFAQVTQLLSSPDVATMAPAAILAAFGPILLVFGVLYAIAVMVMVPIMFAPWPHAYRQLKGADVAATFS